MHTAIDYGPKFVFRPTAVCHTVLYCAVCGILYLIMMCTLI